MEEDQTGRNYAVYFKFLVPQIKVTLFYFLSLVVKIFALYQNITRIFASSLPTLLLQRYFSLFFFFFFFFLFQISNFF
jgi:hypothetical protein